MSRRGIGAVGLVVMLTYIVVIGWPYLRSTFVRDAAVTTWISMTSSLVAGYVRDPLYPGHRIEADGRIASIVDVRADATPLARAEADLVRARARYALQKRVVEAEQLAYEARKTRAESYTAAFVADLDAAIEATDSNIDFVAQQLELARTELVRKSSLSRSGHGSQTAVDTSSLLVTDYLRVLNDLRTTSARLKQRRVAASAGSFLLEDGTDMGQVLNTLDDARARLVRAELELESFYADVEASETTVRVAGLAVERARESAVTGPPGAMIWSLISAPGAPVVPGTPVASWIDCGTMLVDVPASDVEIALLKIGDPAWVVLEGESTRRSGRVMLLRGSAAVIGASDLAALAKGRRGGLGQALVELSPTVDDIARCPVGHAAFVDFPGVHLVDIVRARLRL